MATMYRLGSGTPAALSLGVAVMRGSEKVNSSASSRFSPPIVISNCEPAFPPIGMVVRRRGAGRPTDWANATGPMLHAARPQIAAQSHVTRSIARSALAGTSAAISVRQFQRPYALRSMLVIMRLVIEQKFLGVDQRPDQVLKV